MTSPALSSVRRAIDTETEGMRALAAALDGALGAAVTAAVETMAAARARVIVTGMGKSGHVCRKIAATLASTGTPAYFVHPAEAGHGDLGMITPDDVILAASWSGESTELAAIIAFAGRFRVPLLAITSNAASALGRAADVVMELPRVEEACPHGLAPTTSTLLQLALGDAIAIALLEGRGFTAQDFRIFHPGGKLGASLRMVRDVMHVGDSLPLVASGTSMKEAIVAMSRKGFGCVGVIDDTGLLIGIVTDGDLRRHLSDGLLALTVDAVMTRNPKTTRPEILLGRVIETLNVASITALFVLDAGRPVGIVHVHDLLRVGVA
ncbi:KpsF/GutQ family sugar-phosphate isomerase [Siculibacillus lacustris]|uniref:KpsF/GutQ family sugar-phosphate isomerase n=1 Tax=Siculibacillus lacustris TaxID=1549641 RepID=A0A4Q9VYX8_9HYPH|nr:KpsF/GutQ family sugar-phosphate isomerase [Siculibacillus lacustris]TBW40751.1 KpsF/GutQ family sugar-phosphate isomerase [Siculibacillus lacustris]